MEKRREAVSKKRRRPSVARFFCAHNADGGGMNSFVRRRHCGRDRLPRRGQQEEFANSSHFPTWHKIHFAKSVVPPTR